MCFSCHWLTSLPPPHKWHARSPGHWGAHSPQHHHHHHAHGPAHGPDGEWHDRSHEHWRADSPMHDHHAHGPAHDPDHRHMHHGALLWLACRNYDRVGGSASCVDVKGQKERNYIETNQRC